MTTAAIMQPSFLGWCGYYDMVDQADVFILDDLSQFVAKSWQCRNRIRGRDGNVIWLTVPVHGKRVPLNEVEIAGDAWCQKHLRTLESAYGHTQGWPFIAGLVPGGISPEIRLTNLTVHLINTIAYYLGIDTRIVRASDLGPTRADKTGRIEDICRSVGADVLLDTPGAQAFLGDHDLDGIRIDWHRYQPAHYSQGGKPWHPYLSVIDLIAWHGSDALSIIRQGRLDAATTPAIG